MDHIQCDVLVVGSGGAGLRAAIEAKETLKRGKVVLAVKGPLGRCGVTAIACSDRMAFHATLPYTEPVGSENWKYHAEDIYRIGGYVSDGDLATLLARGSREAFGVIVVCMVMAGQDNIRLIFYFPITELAAIGPGFVRVCDNLNPLIRGEQKGRMSVPFNLHLSLLS